MFRQDAPPGNAQSKGTCRGPSLLTAGHEGTGLLGADGENNHVARGWYERMWSRHSAGAHQV